MLSQCTAVHMASDKDWIARCRIIAAEAGFRQAYPFLGLDDIARRAPTTPVQFLFAHYGVEERLLRETVNTIRHHPEHNIRFMPLIVFTRESNASVMRHFLAMGFDDIITFPCNISHMIARLDMQLGRRLDYFQVGDYFGPDRRRLLEGEEDGPEKRLGGPYTHIVIQRDPETGTRILSQDHHAARNGLEA